MSALISACSLKGEVQTVTTVTLHTSTSVNYPLQTNQIVAFLGGVYGVDAFGSCTDGTQLDMALDPPQQYLPNGAGGYFGPMCPQTMTGLTNLTVTNWYDAKITAWATFQITTPVCGMVVSNYVPADAIVIPASATGGAQIILESSPDLVNWTAASPGTYGPSAQTNRFFRVRAAMTP